MAVIPSSMHNPGFLTPACNACGIFLCWDITPEEYTARKEYWDDWECEECRTQGEFTYDDKVAFVLRVGYSTALIKLDGELGTLLVEKDLVKRVKEQTDGKRISK